MQPEELPRLRARTWDPDGGHCCFDRRYPFAEIPAAIAYLEQGRAREGWSWGWREGWPKRLPLEAGGEPEAEGEIERARELQKELQREDAASPSKPPSG